METAALVAPVTALLFVRDAFLLTGEGPVLTVYSLEHLPKASASLSLLKHCRIHGIKLRRHCGVKAPTSATDINQENDRGLNSNTEPSVYDLVVFGGKALRLVWLHVDLQHEDNLHLKISGPLVELQDWILDICWLSKDTPSELCVALAHNRALLLDVNTGTALLQRSCSDGCLLYSALLIGHECWADVVLVGGTVFNQLVIWKPGGGDGGGGNNDEGKAPVEKRLLGHTGVIFNISYLQEKGLLASASDDRSVRVWGVCAFGVSGGICGDLNPACLRVLYGHEARVFSVHLSPGKVFSAGEDGTCLVWDWAGPGKVVRTLKGHRAGGVRALAVSAGDEGTWVATGGADGGVRVWKLKMEEEMEEAVSEKLTDLKFPDHSIPKVICVAGDGDDNTGWSKIIVCTDQGRVYQHSRGQWEILWQGTPDFHSYCVLETISIHVKDLTAKVTLCAVGNLTGSIQVFSLSHSQSGILLTAGSGKIHSLIWKEGNKGVCLLASSAEGLVYRWYFEVKLNQNGSLSFNVSPIPPFVLPPAAKCWLLAAVYLHSRSEEALWVCGDRRGSLLLFQETGKLIQRKDDGASADGTQQSEVEENDGPAKSTSGQRQDIDTHNIKLQSVSCLFGVHGKQGVTSLCEYKGLIYSTGRDGCVRVCRVKRPKTGEHCKNTVEMKEQPQLEVLRVQRACKGMEWLERVLIFGSETSEEEEEEEFGDESEGNAQTKQRFRGADIKTDNKAQEARFAIVGFHGAHFVVWDPVRQERLLSVPCGGGHRSWSLLPSHMRVWPGYGTLVFIKHGAVFASQTPEKEESLFCRTGGFSLSEGIHGRGIGCVCRLGRIMGRTFDIQTTTSEIEGVRVERDWEVLVTGGEDTSLTVLAVNPDTGKIKVLSVITDHISSVRTVKAITVDQPQSLSALLFSAGGRAQIQCYRLLIVWDRRRSVPSCQVIQVASHRLDEKWERRRNRHKTVKMDPETRYMSIVVLEERSDSFLLALACSDGAVRLFSLSEAKHKFELLWETFYHQRCVLCVATCSLEDPKGNRYKLLFSAATDGKIAVWNLTEFSMSADISISASSTPPVPCLEIPAHQSGINSLAVWSGELTEGGCLVSVVSGGDDSQLRVSRITVQYPEAQRTEFHHINQLRLQCHNFSHIPLAHSAPVTALKLLTSGLLISTSSDQRVCLWSVCNTSISHRKTLCSYVADAAGLSVWEEEMMDRAWRGKGIQAGSGSNRQCSAGERYSKETEPEMVCESTDEKRSGIKFQTQTGGVSERERILDTEAGEMTGWVLVCGQGIQLIQIRNTQVWTGERISGEEEN